MSTLTKEVQNKETGLLTVSARDGHAPSASSSSSSLMPGSIPAAMPSFAMPAPPARKQKPLPLFPVSKRAKVGSSSSSSSSSSSDSLQTAVPMATEAPLREVKTSLPPIKVDEYPALEDLIKIRKDGLVAVTGKGVEGHIFYLLALWHATIQSEELGKEVSMFFIRPDQGFTSDNEFTLAQLATFIVRCLLQKEDSLDFTSVNPWLLDGHLGTPKKIDAGGRVTYVPSPLAKAVLENPEASKITSLKFSIVRALMSGSYGEIEGLLRLYSVAKTACLKEWNYILTCLAQTGRLIDLIGPNRKPAYFIRHLMENDFSQLFVSIFLHAHPQQEALQLFLRQFAKMTLPIETWQSILSVTLEGGYWQIIAEYFMEGSYMPHQNSQLLSEFHNKQKPNYLAVLASSQELPPPWFLRSFIYLVGYPQLTAKNEGESPLETAINNKNMVFLEVARKIIVNVVIPPLRYKTQQAQEFREALDSAGIDEVFTRADEELTTSQQSLNQMIDFVQKMDAILPTAERSESSFTSSSNFFDLSSKDELDEQSAWQLDQTM